MHSRLAATAQNGDAATGAPGVVGASAAGQQAAAEDDVRDDRHDADDDEVGGAGPRARAPCSRRPSLSGERGAGADPGEDPVGQPVMTEEPRTMYECVEEPRPGRPGRRRRRRRDEREARHGARQRGGARHRGRRPARACRRPWPAAARQSPVWCRARPCAPSQPPRRRSRRGVRSAYAARLERQRERV